MVNNRIVWAVCLGLLTQQTLADMTSVQQALGAGDYTRAEQALRPLADAGEANAQYQLGRLYEKGQGLVKDEAWAITWYRKAADQGHSLAIDSLNRIYSAAGIPSPYVEKLKADSAQQVQQAQQPPPAQPVQEPLPEPVIQPAQARQPTADVAGTTGPSRPEQLRQMAAALDAQSNGDFATAAAGFQKLASAGLPAAQVRLAGMYLRGEGLEQDASRAADLYRQAAEQGHAGAQFQIARMYQKGHGIEQDDDQAFSWYRAASAQGHEAANHEFDAMIEAAETQRMTTQQAAEAEAEKAVVAEAVAQEKEAETGPAEESASVGGFFSRLFGGGEEATDSQAEDVPQAVEEQQPAPVAVAESPASIEDASREHTAQEEQLSQPIPLDENNALPQPQPIAAEAESLPVPVVADTSSSEPPVTDVSPTNESAQAKRAAELQAEAVRYQMGDGVEKDLGRAARLYQEAAELGNADAQFNLGNMYLLGEGLVADDAWAVTWYRKAAAQGHPEAKQNLDNLYRASGLQPPPLPTVAMAEHTAAESPAENESVSAVAEREVAAHHESSLENSESAVQVDDTESELAVSEPEPAETEAQAQPEKGFFASLFGGKDEPEEAAEVVQAEQARPVAEAEPEPEPEPEPELNRDEPVAVVEVAAQTPEAEKKGFFASLFGGNAEPEEATDVAEPVVVESVAEAEPVRDEPVAVVEVVAPEPEPEAAVDVEVAAAVQEPDSGPETESEAEKKGFFARLFSGSDEAEQAIEQAAEPEVEELQQQPGLLADEAEAEPQSAAVESVDDTEVLSEQLADQKGDDLSLAQTEETEAVQEKGFFSRLFGRDEAQTTQAAETTFDKSTPVADEPTPDAMHDVPAITASVPTTAATVPGFSAGGMAATASAKAVEQTASTGGFLSSLFGGGSATEEQPTAETLTIAEVEQAVADSTTQTAAAEPSEQSVSTSTQKELERIQSRLEEQVTSPTEAVIEEPGVTIQQAKDALQRREYTTALQMFRELAEQGDAEAQAHLGYMFFIGEGLEKDSREAVYWLRESAKQGDADGQYNLAVAYAFGDGVEQSDNQAVYWYRKAAQQGHLKAQYSLAISYTRGEGVAADLVEAVRWYRSAAEGGDADAQYYLGYLLQVGAGLEQNRDEALKWFRRAADQGHAEAEEQAANMVSDSATY